MRALLFQILAQFICSTIVVSRATTLIAESTLPNRALFAETATQQDFCDDGDCSTIWSLYITSTDTSSGVCLHRPTQGKELIRGLSTSISGVGYRDSFCVECSQLLLNDCR